SFESSIELEVLSLRLFEVDPSYAVRYLQTVDFPRHVLWEVFRGWARIDLEALIALIDEVRDSADRTRLALAIIEVAGEGAIGRIAAEAQTLTVDGLMIAALTRRARVDLAHSLQSVPELIG